jgi:Glycosyl transferase family 2
VPSVSVVVTTQDDRLSVRDCIDRVLASAGAGSVSEVLVVDRGSVDGTADIVRRVGGPVRLIERPGDGLAAAVAAGIAEARGDVLALVPGRALMGAGAIEACTAEAAAGRDGPAVVELRPVGTTAFGRAAAAVVGREVPRVEAWPRRGASSPGSPAAPPAVRPSYYLLADRPADLAADAFRARAGWRSTANAAMVVSSLGLAVFGRGWLRAAVPALHAAATAVRAVRAGSDPGVAPHRAFLAVEVWDWSSGVGRLATAVRRVRRLRR